jgi:hypothetical protein
MVLRRVIEDAWVLIVRRGSYQFCAVQLFFTGGGNRSYLILNQSAGYRRPGGWWASSLESAAKAEKVDLRKRKQAERLVSLLSNVDPKRLKG